MKRREIITLIGGAVAWSLAARAQQPDRMKRLGVLIGLAEHDPEAKARLVGFWQAFERLGWFEGRNVSPQSGAKRTLIKRAAVSSAAAAVMPRH
jgi:putative tryptophan/tyrosine transport system substrate-binding protein